MPSTSITTNPLFNDPPPRKRPSSLAELRAFQKQRSLPSSQESLSSQSSPSSLSSSSSSSSPIKKFKPNHIISKPVSTTSSLPFFFQKSIPSSKKVDSTTLPFSSSSSSSSESTSTSTSIPPTPFFTATETKTNPFLLDSSTSLSSLPTNPFHLLIPTQSDSGSTDATLSCPFDALDDISSSLTLISSSVQQRKEEEKEKEKEKGNETNKERKKLRIHEVHPTLLLQGAILPIHTSEALYRFDDSYDDVLPPFSSSSLISSSSVSNPFYSTSNSRDPLLQSNKVVMHQDELESLNKNKDTLSVEAIEQEEEDEVDPWSEATFSKTDMKLAQMIVPPSFSSSFSSNLGSDHSPYNTINNTTWKSIEKNHFHDKHIDSDDEMEKPIPLLHDTQCLSIQPQNPISISSDRSKHEHGSLHVHVSSTETEMEVIDENEAHSSLHGLIDVFPSSSSSSSKSSTTSTTTTTLTTSIGKRPTQMQGIHSFLQFQYDSNSLLQRLVFYNDIAPWPETFLSPSLHVSCAQYFTASSPFFSSSSSTSLSTSSDFVTDVDACLFYFTLTSPRSKSHWEMALDHLFSSTSSPSSSASASFYYLHSHVGIHVTSSHFFICTSWTSWIHQCIQTLQLHVTVLTTSPLILATIDRSAHVDSVLGSFLKKFDEWKPPLSSSSASFLSSSSLGPFFASSKSITNATSSMNSQFNKQKKELKHEPGFVHPTFISNAPFLYGVLDKAKITRCGPIQQLHGLTHCLQIDGYVMPSSIKKLEHTLKKYLPSHQLNQLKLQVDYEPLAQFFNAPSSVSLSLS